MNRLPLSIVVISAVTAGSAALAKPADRTQTQSVGQLRSALAAVVASADAQGPKPPDHFNPKVSNGQGAEHANPGAILRVCSKDTPAAHRAAICEVSISPE